MRRTRWLVFFVAAALAGAAGCSDSSDDPGAEPDADVGGGVDGSVDPGAPDAAAPDAAAPDAYAARGDVELRRGGAVVASGGSFDFGTIPVDSVGARYAFSIHNVGDGALSVASVSVAGANAAAFSVAGAGTMVIDVGQSMDFTVGFAPTATGANAATLTVTSDDPDTPAHTLALTGTGVLPQDLTDDTDGDWSDVDFTAYDTIESRIVVRVGDIDNLGFGWPSNFDPFSGQSTPSHSYPWVPGASDPAGTDRVMVVSSYVGTPPAGSDGYTSSTSRPDNLPQPITMTYDPLGSVPSNAVMQVFVDDFQAPVWQASYQVTLDGVRAPFMEQVLNALVQTGPIGKLITLPLPPEFVDLLADGELVIAIDDPTTGAGDGFAIDFVKLFIDVYGFKNTGTVTGTVTEAGTGTPLAGVEVTASGFVTTTTGTDGSYTLADVPAGFVYIRATTATHQPFERLLDLQTGQNAVVDAQLTPL